MFFPFQFPAAGLSLYRSLSLLQASCSFDTHLGLSIASNEHERPGFRDEIIIRRHRVHDPREEANPLGHDSGQAVPTAAPAGVPLSREVFEQDGVSRPNRRVVASPIATSIWPPERKMAYWRRGLSD